MLGPRHGATMGGPVLMPLASGHSAGHFWFPLFLQGFCTKMCLLCPSYPPCTGRNHSPGDGQVPGPAQPCWSCLGWPQVSGPSGRDEQAPLPPVPLGRGTCVVPSARTVQVSPHELEGNGGPCCSAAPLPPQLCCPSMSGLAPGSVSSQLRRWGSRREKDAVCAGDILGWCTSLQHQVFHTCWPWGSRPGSGLS